MIFSLHNGLIILFPCVYDFWEKNKNNQSIDHSWLPWLPRYQQVWGAVLPSRVRVSFLGKPAGDNNPIVQVQTKHHPLTNAKRKKLFQVSALCTVRGGERSDETVAPKQNLAHLSRTIHASTCSYSPSAWFSAHTPHRCPLRWGWVLQKWGQGEPWRICQLSTLLIFFPNASFLFRWKEKYPNLPQGDSLKSEWNLLFASLCEEGRMANGHCGQHARELRDPERDISCSMPWSLHQVAAKCSIRGTRNETSLKPWNRVNIWPTKHLLGHSRYPRWLTLHPYLSDGSWL